MVDEEGRHPESGRVSDPERPAPRPVEGRRAAPPAPGRQVVDQVQAEVPDQVDGEHLRLEGEGEQPPAAHLLEVREAELPVPVDGGRPHEIPHAAGLVLRRLASGGEGVHHRVEQPHAPVGAAQHDLPRAAAPRLLPRHVVVEPVEVGRGRGLEGEGEARVPALGDHAVGPVRGVEVVGEGREPEHPGRGMDMVGGPPVAVVVEVAEGGLDAPALPGHAADEDPGEAQAGRVEPAEPGEPHHLARRAEGRGSVRAGDPHAAARSFRERVPGLRRPCRRSKGGASLPNGRLPGRTPAVGSGDGLAARTWASRGGRRPEPDNRGPEEGTAPSGRRGGRTSSLSLRPWTR